MRRATTGSSVDSSQLRFNPQGQIGFQLTRSQITRLLEFARGDNSQSHDAITLKANITPLKTTDVVFYRADGSLFYRLSNVKSFEGGVYGSAFKLFQLPDANKLSTYSAYTHITGAPESHLLKVFHRHDLTSSYFNSSGDKEALKRIINDTDTLRLDSTNKINLDKIFLADSELTDTAKFESVRDHYKYLSNKHWIKKRIAELHQSKLTAKQQLELLRNDIDKNITKRKVDWLINEQNLFNTINGTKRPSSFYNSIPPYTGKSIKTTPNPIKLLTPATIIRYDMMKQKGKEQISECKIVIRDDKESIIEKGQQDASGFTYKTVEETAYTRAIEQAALVQPLLSGVAFDHYFPRSTDPIRSVITQQPTESKWQLAGTFANELKNLHRRRIIHLDLKMDNVLIDLPNLQAKIIDFGLAQQCKGRLLRASQPCYKTDDNSDHKTIYPNETHTEGEYQGAWTDVYMSAYIIVMLLLKDGQIFDKRAHLPELDEPPEGTRFAVTHSSIAEKLNGAIDFPANITANQKAEFIELLLQMRCKNHSRRPNANEVHNSINALWEMAVTAAKDSADNGLTDSGIETGHELTTQQHSSSTTPPSPHSLGSRVVPTPVDSLSSSASSASSPASTDVRRSASGSPAEAEITPAEPQQKAANTTTPPQPVTPEITAAQMPAIARTPPLTMKSPKDPQRTLNNLILSKGIIRSKFRLKARHLPDTQTTVSHLLTLNLSRRQTRIHLRRILREKEGGYDRLNQALDFLNLLKIDDLELKQTLFDNYDKDPLAIVLAAVAEKVQIQQIIDICRSKNINLNADHSELEEREYIAQYDASLIKQAAILQATLDFSFLEKYIQYDASPKNTEALSDLKEIIRFTANVLDSTHSCDHLSIICREFAKRITSKVADKHREKAISNEFKNLNRDVLTRYNQLQQYALQKRFDKIKDKRATPQDPSLSMHEYGVSQRKTKKHFAILFDNRRPGLFGNRQEAQKNALEYFEKMLDKMTTIGQCKAMHLKLCNLENAQNSTLTDEQKKCFREKIDLRIRYIFRDKLTHFKKHQKEKYNANTAISSVGELLYLGGLPTPSKNNTGKIDKIEMDFTFVPLLVKLLVPEQTTVNELIVLFNTLKIHTWRAHLSTAPQNKAISYIDDIFIKFLREHLEETQAFFNRIGPLTSSEFKFVDYFTAHHQETINNIVNPVAPAAETTEAASLSNSHPVSTDAATAEAAARTVSLSNTSNHSDDDEDQVSPDIFDDTFATFHSAAVPVR